MQREKHLTGQELLCSLRTKVILLIKFIVYDCNAVILTLIGYVDCIFVTLRN